MRKWTYLLAALLGVGVAACQTTFYGSPEFPGGPRGCYERCKAKNMDMATFVYVGEYSTACACRPREAAAETESEGNVSATTAAAAGVVMQMDRQQQQQQQAQTQQH